MTFVEAAIELLKRTGRPLHFKELTELAIEHNLLSVVGRTPETTMQTRLAAELRNGEVTPLIRVGPGLFGLKSYPSPSERAELARAEEEPTAAKARPEAAGRPKRRRRGAKTAVSTSEESSTELAVDPSPPVVEREPQVAPASKRAATKGSAGTRSARPSRSAAEKPAKASTAAIAEAVAQSAPESRLPVSEAGMASAVSGEPAPALAVYDDPDLELTSSDEGEFDSDASPEGETSQEGDARPRRRRRRRRRGGAGRSTTVPLEAPAAAEASLSPSELSIVAPVAAPATTLPPPLNPPATAPARSASVSRTDHSAPRSTHTVPRPEPRYAAAELATWPPATFSSSKLTAEQLQRMRDRRSSGLRPMPVGERATRDGLIEAELRVERSIAELEGATLRALELELQRLDAAAFERLARLVIERAIGVVQEELERRAGSVFLLAANEVTGRTLVQIHPDTAPRAPVVEELRRRAGELGIGQAAVLSPVVGDEMAQRAAWSRVGARPVAALHWGPALARLLAQRGIGLVRATIPVGYLDAELFAALASGSPRIESAP